MRLKWRHLAIIRVTVSSYGLQHPCLCLSVSLFSQGSREGGRELACDEGSEEGGSEGREEEKRRGVRGRLRRRKGRESEMEGG